MPTRDRVEAFIELVVSGVHDQAIADFYHHDATMQENLKPPRAGRDVLIAHERAAMARVKHIHTHRPLHVAIDGDTVAVNWVFDFTGHDDVTRRLIEVAVQTWDGDRIRHEQFFYDTATAWQVVGA